MSFNPPSEGYWVIPSARGDILLANTLLPKMTQDESAKYVSKDGFHSMSIPEHFELFDALYTLREKGGNVEQARQFVQTSMRNSSSITQTRIIYTPKGFDRIVHGYETPSAIEKKARIVGLDGNVLDVLTPRASQALTGKNPEQVAELIEYINETRAFIYGLNQKPVSIDERVARFFADSGWAILSCDGNPASRDGALGVKFVGKK